MDQSNRKIQTKILIANILQVGINEENTPIIVDLINSEKNENSDLLIFTLESMNLLTPALKILISNYKLNAIKNYLNLDTDNYISNREELIYITSPRNTYTKLDEKTALKQVFKMASIRYPIIGELAPLNEQFEYFDEEDNIWKKCIRKYKINSIGRVVEFLSEKIILIPNRPAPILNDNFTYSDLGKEFFDTTVTEEDLLKEDE